MFTANNNYNDNMKIKNLFPLLMATMLIFAITACGGTSGNGGDLASVTSNRADQERDDDYIIPQDKVNGFEVEMLNEVNFARLNPKDYAHNRLQEGSEAYYDLQARGAVAALKLDPRISRAAQKYAEVLSLSATFGHFADGSNPSDRCIKEGVNGGCGENIASGSSGERNALVNPKLAARTFVIQLIVDEGVYDRGHRKNILNPAYKLLGIGFAREENSQYLNYCVQDFAK
ncbi:MAG: CAP domain-containing protein [Oligoflexia bacterium]|nr:CAP domain-containing protein [Oligoflexia bacterium]MBF0367118.1 CAP domain-containing protein [Oligoflexia bacterium]